MRAKLLAYSFWIAALPAFGQAAPPPNIGVLATSADVQALIAKARSEMKPGAPLQIEPIVKLAPYTANLEYRVQSTRPAIHEKQAELFYVMEGAGKLTVGGTLVGESRTNPSNLAGTAIQGGTDYSLSKGDFYFVPEGVPHMLTPVGGPLVDMSMHLTRPVAAH